MISGQWFRMKQYVILQIVYQNANYSINEYNDFNPAVDVSFHISYQLSAISFRLLSAAANINLNGQVLAIRKYIDERNVWQLRIY
jgi:hypothetical protein